MDQTLIEWARQYQQYALFFVPLFAFMETCVGIGLFVSSLFLVVLCSIFYANGWADISTMAVLAAVGSSLGDHVGFYFGRRTGIRIQQLKVVQRNMDNWQRSETLVQRFGPWAIFIGRFIPAIRSVIPAMLGMSGFTRRRYTILDILACSLWAMALAVIVFASHDAFTT